MQIQIVTNVSVLEVFEDLKAAKRKYPQLDPEKDTTEFARGFRTHMMRFRSSSWAYDFSSPEDSALRIEDWSSQRIYA